MPDATNFLLFIIAFLIAVLLFGVILLLFRRQEREASESSFPTTSSDEQPQRQYSKSSLKLLTPSEREIALLAARGLTNWQIAAELGLSIYILDVMRNKRYCRDAGICKPAKGQANVSGIDGIDRKGV